MRNELQVCSGGIEVQHYLYARLGRTRVVVVVNTERI